MLDLLLSGIFWLINFVANLILQPIMWLLSVLVGNVVSSTLGLILNSVFTLLSIMDTYVLFAVDFLCIPRSLFLFVFTIIAGILTYVVFARIYIFTITVYNHFKP